MFVCQNTSGCVRLASGIPGECDAMRLKNGYLCLKTDKNSDKYDKNYEEHVSGVKRRKVNTVKISEPKKVVPVVSVHKALKIVSECKHRSKKIQKTNDEGRAIIVHIITNDDGSTVEYSDCGCGMNRCGLNKGKDGFVNFQDCSDCVTEQGLVSLDSELPKNPGFGDTFPNLPGSSEANQAPTAPTAPTEGLKSGSVATQRQ